MYIIIYFIFETMDSTLQVQYKTKQAPRCFIKTHEMEIGTFHRLFTWTPPSWILQEFALTQDEKIYFKITWYLLI